ncbi:MAG TPA: hypothetical protein VM658_09930 [bacterium]|nr:hypothetical protein [bacterium]
MPKTEIDFPELLKALSAAGVDYIVVGGVCAVLHGAPLSTFDLDLVYSRDRENLVRLDQALKELESHYRMKPEAAPDAHLLDGPGHHLLMTRLGPLDLLGSTVGGEGYQELIAHTETVDLGVGKTVRILDLPTLIRIKQSLARDRDLAVLPILKKTLEEKGKK